MRTLFFILLMLTAPYLPCRCQERRIAGSELTGIACLGEAGIFTGYAFANKWSVQADISIAFKRMLPGRSEEEKEHWNELYGYEDKVAVYGGDLSKCSLSMCYWTSSSYSGGMLSIGGCIWDRSGPDILTEIGYWCRIWEGIRCGFTYRLRIMEYIKTGQLPTDGIRIYLGYAF